MNSPVYGDSDCQLFFKICSSLSERNGGTHKPIYGDSINSLLLKISRLLMDNAPKYGDSDNTLLRKIASALDSLSATIPFARGLAEVGPTGSVDIPLPGVEETAFSFVTPATTDGPFSAQAVIIGTNLHVMLWDFQGAPAEGTVCYVVFQPV